MLLLLYSVVLTKGVEQIKNEVEDLGEALIDGTYGHGRYNFTTTLLFRTKSDYMHSLYIVSNVDE